MRQNMRNARRLVLVFAIVTGVSAAAGTAAAQQPLRFAGAPCATPPVLHCPDANCPRDIMTNRGPATESRSERTYFLDYPCDLRPDEPVTFILSLHGGGSSGQWQRHYFPIFDYKDRHRLVIATPYSPTRSWSEADDAYLQNIVTSVVEQIGRKNVKAFWLVGHSQGGATSRRLVCTEFFRNKVDGFLSLSGGRVGGAPERAARAGRPAQAGEKPVARGAPPAAGRGGAPAELPGCDFSHVYATGEHEITALPSTSSWAARYGCGARLRRGDIVDTKAGYVHDGGRQNPGTKEWGLLPRPGKAEVFTFPDCADGRVVADVVRIDKGHTEGLEPQVTEELVRLMLSARGGKIQRGG
jgi:poly(3-hydroxybutyrate) depolymerase